MNIKLVHMVDMLVNQYNENPTITEERDNETLIATVVQTMSHYSAGVSREEESLHCLTRWHFHHTFALSLTFIQLIIISLTSFSFILALLHYLLLTLLTLPILPLHLHYLCYSFFLFFFLPSFSTLPHVGPTELTANRFWDMVWDYQIPTIVMLTRCVEDGKVC